MYLKQESSHTEELPINNRKDTEELPTNNRKDCSKIKLKDLIRQQNNVTSIETTDIDKRTNVFMPDEGCFYIDLGIKEVSRQLNGIDWYDGKKFYLNKGQVVSCDMDKENCKYGWRLVTMSNDSTYCINKNNYKKIEACK